MRTCVWRALFAGGRMATIRKRKKAYPVRPNEGRKIIRLTTVSDAVIYEQLGIWRREYDSQTGELLGFRLVGAELRKVDSDLMSIHSSSAISAGEMQRNLMCSRTHGLREEARMQRIKDGEPPEDQVERTRAKIRVYPFVGAKTGAILDAWPRA